MAIKKPVCTVCFRSMEYVRTQGSVRTFKCVNGQCAASGRPVSITDTVATVLLSHPDSDVQPINSINYGVGKTRGDLVATEMTVVKKADDSSAIRVSVGGNNYDGMYCTYRGKKEDCISVLEAALTAMKNLKAELPVSPDLGKRYS